MDNKTDHGVDLDSLKLDSNEMTWGDKPLPRDTREIGNKTIINSTPNPSTTPNQNSTPVPRPEQIPDIPKAPEIPMDTLPIVPGASVDTPPEGDKISANTLSASALETPSKPKDTAVVKEALNTPFDKSAFKTTDKLDQTGVTAIDSAVEKLNQDGDIASFYDTARQMMEANLDNSYNRKIGEGIK